MRRRHPTRRDIARLLGGAALAPGALALPRMALAQDAAQRRFLFVFVSGGWDPTFVFTPDLDDPGIWQDPDGRAAEAGGHRFLDAPNRPAVRDFFSRWGDQTALINGMEVRSVTHEACRRIALTGGTDPLSDDWPALIAGNRGDDILPDLVLSGPAFTARHTGVVTRAGPDGQLGRLLQGTAVQQGDLPAGGLGDAATARVEAFLAEEAAALRTGHVRGQAAGWLDDYASTISNLERVRVLGQELSLGGLDDDWFFVRERVQPAIDAFALGLSRCAVVEHLGEWDVGWDTHSGIGTQAAHYQTLFVDLNDILDNLAGTTGPAGGALLDEVTVVVMSEMGRAPSLNAVGGKNHWTFTSAMLIGAGVRGGAVAGGYADGLVGAPTDLTTGLVDPAGVRLTSAHLGATLMSLAGLDAATLVPGAVPLDALLRA
jgi:hypothetical protein